MRHRADDSAADTSEDAAERQRAPGASLADDGTVAGHRSARVRVGLGAVVVLLIAAAVVAVLVSATAEQGSSVGVPTASGRAVPPTSASSVSNAPAAERVLVHVAGAVRKPGLVSLGTGARVVDAVAAAGGLADDADPAGVNLARPVADGEQLVVPKVGEAAPATVGGGVATGGAATAAAGAPVNVNTATQAELETLPRIGPALAQRILDWRSANGRFAQVTDLMKVSGIGQKLFDGLKDRVVV